MSPTRFCASSYHFRDIYFVIFYLQTVCQGYRVQFLQLHHSRAKSTNVSDTFLRLLLEFRRYHFFLYLTDKKQVMVKQCNFCNYTIRWQMSKSTYVSHTFLCQLLPFQKYKYFKCLTSKSRSRSQSTIFSITPFNSKCQNPQTIFFIHF